MRIINRAWMLGVLLGLNGLVFAQSQGNESVSPEAPPSVGVSHPASTHLPQMGLGHRMGSEDIPPSLQPWRRWALQGKEQTQCHLKFSKQGQNSQDYTCVGVGVSEVDPVFSGNNDKPSGLVIRAQVYGMLPQDSLNTLPLPSSQNQSLRVTLDGQEARVLEREGNTWIRVPQGIHTLVITIDQPHEVIEWPHPWNMAMVGNQPLSTDKQQLFWTQTSSVEQTTQTNRMDLRVYRKWTDHTVPLLETQMVIHVSGSARWETWKEVLPEGFEMISWQSTWPVQWTKDNSLSVKVNQGKGLVTLQARCVSCSSKITHKQRAGWPDSEIWSFQTQNQIRQVGIEGIGVDAKQAGVPGEWNDLQSYRLSSSTPIQLAERSRGGQSPAELQVVRKAWFDGRQWFVEDTLKGQAPTGTRLSLKAPYQMVSFAQQQTHLPLTQHHKENGVNWNGGAIDATVRFTTPDLSYTSGWSVPVQQLDQHLYTAPHHKVIHIDSGKQDGTWVSRLNVWVFFCAFVLFWITKSSLGWAWGGVVFALTMAPVAPYSFLFGGLVFLIVAIRLIADRLYAGQPVRHGWMRMVMLIGVLLAGVVWVAQFATHIRQVMYPNLDVSIGLELASPTAPYTRIQSMEKATMASGSVAMDAMVPAPPSSPVQDPNASLGVVQAGLSSPVWYSGMTQSTSQGPILNDEAQSIFILPHWLWSVLQMIQFGLWALLWIKLSMWAFRTSAPSAPQWAKRLLALGLLCLPGVLMAQTGEQVHELSARMTQAPSCAPHCVVVTQAQGRMDQQVLRLTLHTDVAYASVLRLPLMEGGYLQSVQVNNRPGVMDGRDVLLTEGQSTVELRFVLTQPQASLSFVQKPMSYQLDAIDWDSQMTQGQWVFTRTQKIQAQDTDEDQKVSDIPQPDVRLIRRIHLGDRVSMHTTVTRLGKLGEGRSMVPLVKGERGVQAQQLQEKGAWVIVWKEGQNKITYESELDVTDRLVLEAMSADKGSESWHITHAPTWVLGDSNLPRSFVSSKEQTFFPKPKETLTLPLNKPVFAEGEVVRVQQVHIQSSRGTKISTHQMQLEAFATQGDQLGVTLPSGSQLKHVLMDNTPVALGLSGQKLTLPLPSGLHRVQVEWSTPSQGVVDHVPRVVFDQPVSNIQWQVEYPERWVIWTHGERWGMSIMYWPYLIVLLLLAWMASRVEGLGLTVGQALLLTFGFSLLSPWALMVVVAWLLMVRWRERMEVLPNDKVAFNNKQVLLAVLTGFMVLVVFVQVTQGLMGAAPNMFMKAPHGLPLFTWYQPTTSGVIEGPTLVSFDMWVYRIMICVWALWMAKWLTQSLQRALKAWTHLGHWMGGAKPSEG